MPFACSAVRHRAVALGLAGAAVSTAVQSCRPSAVVRDPTPQKVGAIADSLQAARDSALRLVGLRIAGRDMLPAESVFTNVQIARGIPAARLPQLMNSMARSLGVRCTFCHDTSDWGSDVKPPKNTARRMSAMVRNLNSELLPRALDRAPGASPLVTCATCHRGSRKPATELR